jgi:hypothetical protein
MSTMHTTSHQSLPDISRTPDQSQAIATIRRRVRWLLLFVMVGLVVSGLTAVPLEWGGQVLNTLFGPGTLMESVWPAMAHWIAHINEALATNAASYPVMFYGTDWLAFAHIVIAIAFIGPLRDPVRNIWVIEFGLIACALVIPAALIFGPLRGIPFFWQLIDCSFGVGGFSPLWFTRQQILKLERLEKRNQ